MLKKPQTIDWSCRSYKEISFSNASSRFKNKFQICIIDYFSRG